MTDIDLIKWANEIKLAVDHNEDKGLRQMQIFLQHYEETKALRIVVESCPRCGRGIEHSSACETFDTHPDDRLQCNDDAPHLSHTFTVKTFDGVNTVWHVCPGVVNEQ